VLAAANGEIVSKDELMARVWGGRIVEENNIQVHVSALRKALAGAKADESHVVAVPHRGYRLIGLHAASQLMQSGALCASLLDRRVGLA
jgi:DNA-binding winged helix-turn-helix (wHTH) protein